MGSDILVLDDDESYADMLNYLLHEHNFKVKTTTEPEEALEALREGSYSLVVSDYNMPVMQGAEFLEKARHINPQIPVIIVSGYMNTPELVKVANLGVTAVMEKPFDAQVFLKHVNKYASPLCDRQEIKDANTNCVEPTRGESDLMKRTVNKTYPDSLGYLADVHLSSQTFIQKLWDITQEKNTLFVDLPKGSEFELMVREVSRWKEFDEKPSHYLSAKQLNRRRTEGLLKSISDDNNLSNIVGVIDTDKASNEDFICLVNLIKSNEQSLSSSNKLTYIIQIKDRSLIEPATDTNDGELNALYDENFLNLKPLNERITDLAEYTTRYLPLFAEKEKREIKSILSPEAIRLLLNYSWPGNFSELLNTLRRSVMIASHDTLNASDIETILIRDGGQITNGARAIDLAFYLKQKQLHYLNGIKERVGDDPKTVLSAAGEDPDNLNDNMLLDDLQLLYPNLLNENMPSYLN